MVTAPRRLTPLTVRPSSVTASAPTDRATVLIYRPFFLAGIVTVLTVGCLLGAIALLGISRQESYLATAWTPYVLAHANSQLFGWVGFFVMGFALQQHGTTLARQARFLRNAYAALGLMGAGIALRFVAEPLAQMDAGRFVGIGVLSGVLQLGAVLVFADTITRHRHRTGEGLTWPPTFVFGSLACLLLVAFADPFVFVLSHQVDRTASIAFVAEWFTPLREVQFLGFAAMMIFGVASSKFPGCLGFRPAVPAWGLAGFGCWTSGLLLRVVGWTAHYDAGLAPGTDVAFRAGGVLLFLGALCMTHSLGVFAKVRKVNASQKFIRAAFAWLLIAGAMLVLEPFHLSAIDAPFSHAYTGAIRHAVTVGLISQMIIAVGYHLVTRMRMMDERAVPALWSVWILMNVGNLGRVSLEVTTDYTHRAFAPMGVTGFIELTGLSIWAYVMVKLILERTKSYATVC